MTETSILDALNNPAMRHAAIVHMPIALSVLAVPLTFISALVTTSKPLRLMALAVAGLLLLTAWIGVQSGEAAYAQLSGLPHEVDELVEEHEHLAEKIWIFALATMSLVAIGFASHRGIRLASSWLAVVAAVGGAAWVANTAHHGGLAVYQHAVGVQQPVPRTALPANDDEDDTPSFELLPPSAPPAADARLVHFEQTVLSLLSNNCFRCHNPRRANRSGHLDQTSIASMLEDRGSGPAVIPGKPEVSNLVLRMRSTDDRLLMPPDSDPMPEHALAAIEQWIRDGAVWPAQNPAPNRSRSGDHARQP